MVRRRHYGSRQSSRSIPCPQIIVGDRVAWDDGSSLLLATVEAVDAIASVVKVRLEDGSIAKWTMATPWLRRVRSPSQPGCADSGDHDSVIGPFLETEPGEPQTDVHERTESDDPGRWGDKT